MNDYHFSAMQLGLAEAFTVTIDEAKLASFTALSGDVNPLHTDPSYAESKGFQGCVVHGLLSASFYSTLVGVYLPGRYAILQGVDTVFSKPVYVGDELTIRGEVSYINDAYQHIEITAYIHNHLGDKVSKALIKVGFLHGE